MASQKIKECFNYYLENQDELVKKYEGRVLLIHNNSVIKDFDSKAEAYYYGLEHFTAGEFMIIKCTYGESEYTVNKRTITRFPEWVSA